MPRREITDRLSWDDSYTYVAYTADALSLAAEDGDKEVGALAPRAEKILSGWDALDGERRGGRRAIGRAHALVKRRDLQLDGATADLHNDVIGHVRQDRAHPLFVRFFPAPLSSVVRKALERQLPDARALLHKLAEPETPAELRKAHEKPLEQHIERGEKALRHREEIIASAGRVSSRIGAWKADANHTLLGIEGALKEMAGKRRLKTDWVDGFFAAPERAAGGGSDGGEGGDSAGGKGPDGQPA